MSQKTYVCYKAGYTGFQYYPEVPGQDGLIGYPLDGEPKEPFKTRLGARNCGSGPWFTAFYDGSAPMPSTDGLYSIGWGYGQYNAGQYEAIATSCNELWVVGGRSLTSGRSDLVGIIHRVIKSVEKIATNRYRLHCESWSYWWPGSPAPPKRPTRYPDGCPFNNTAPSRMFADRDYDAARRCIAWGKRAIATMQLRTYRSDLIYDVYTTGSHSKYGKIVQFDPSPDVMLFSEHLYQAQLYVDLGILPGSWAMGLESAYVDACNNLPQAATNMAANILEAASTLANLWHGNFGAVLPSSPQDAWLFYRYAYTTTKLDVRELRSAADRFSALSQLNIVKAYGSYARGDTQYRVGFDIDTAQILPRDVSTTLQKFGLELNLLNVWDMIPYSFVVDWFIPVAEVIEYFQNLDACKYEPHDLWWSIVTTRDGCRSYSRLPGRKLSTLPYLSIKDTSRKTLFMRVGDAIALFS